MHIVTIAWIFVVGLAALVEGTSPQGSWLGALITFTFWGLLPLGLVLYVLDTPNRKRARRTAEQQAAGSGTPDGGGVTAGDGLAPEREEA
jgi:hypothetical protein